MIGKGDKSVIFLSRKQKIIFFAFLDAILIAGAVWFAFFLRFDAKIPSFYFDTIKKVAFLAIFFLIPTFYFSGLYHFSLAYISIKEVISLLKAVFISFIFLTTTLYFSSYFPGFLGFPRSTLVISFFLIIFLSGALRFSKRAFLDIFKKPDSKVFRKKLLIAGAGDAGEQIVRNIVGSETPYQVFGFVDDSREKQSVSIHGIKVLGQIKDIPQIVLRFNIEEVIIALPSAKGETVRRTIELSREAGIKKIRIVPAIAEVIGGQISLKDIRDVQAEDLLGREIINLDTNLIENFIRNKIILITGSAGSIGSELSRQTARFKPSLLLLLDRDETGIFNISNELEERFPNLKIISLLADIQDYDKINYIFEKFKPKIVFHAAAYKHVPLMEENLDQAVNNNIFGTKIVADAAFKNQAESFVFISTDKAVNPTSIMGATKRIGEMVCQNLNQKNSTKFISVRFGNVLDSRGSVIPIFREQIRKRGPVTVTHPDMKRYFMLTSEAVLLVMQAGAMGKGGEVFILDMGKPIKILELAKEMIKFSGFEPDKDIPIVFTGSRPGEKLFEEILTAEEGTKATKHQKIFIANSLDINLNLVEANLKELKLALENKIAKEEIIKILKKIIPTYNNKMAEGK